MRKIVVRVLKVLGILVALLALGGGSYVYMQCSAFDASMAKVYDVPIPNLTRSTDPAVIARGDHLVHSMAVLLRSEIATAPITGGS